MGISIMLYTANDLPILCYAVLRWAVSSVGSERLVYTQKVGGLCMKGNLIGFLS